MSLKLAVVIGANTKTGWQTVKDLLLQEFIVVGLSSSLQSVESLKNHLRSKYQDAFHTRECDFSSLDAVKTSLLWIVRRFPATTEILIHGNNEHDIDRLINVSNTLVGCRTIWRRAEKENANTFLWK